MFAPEIEEKTLSSLTRTGILTVDAGDGSVQFASRLAHTYINSVLYSHRHKIAQPASLYDMAVRAISNMSERAQQHSFNPAVRVRFQGDHSII